MFELGPHATFILAAYGVTFIAIGALTLATIMDDRGQRRMLAELERKGIRRRSAANETPKRKPATARPRTNRS